MKRKAWIKVNGIILGYKEIELLRQLADGRKRTIWELLKEHNLTNAYAIVIYERFTRLKEKGLVSISYSGPKHGKAVKITERGLEVLRKLNM